MNVQEHLYLVWAERATPPKVVKSSCGSSQGLNEKRVMTNQPDKKVVLIDVALLNGSSIGKAGPQEEGRRKERKDLNVVNKLSLF